MALPCWDLGDIGPDASKPVMEGKGVLFKVFADLDCFDIEVDASDVDTFVQTVKAIAHVRRHQPRGHQGAGSLRNRAPTQGGARHPGHAR